MPFMQKDVVLTTEEAMEYLKISKPTFLINIFASEESRPSKQERVGGSSNQSYIDS